MQQQQQQQNQEEQQQQCQHQQPTAAATSTASGAVSRGEAEVSTDAEVGSSSSFSSCSDSDEGDAGDDIDFLFAELMAEDIPEAVAAAVESTTVALASTGTDSKGVATTTTADPELPLYMGGGDGGQAPGSVVADMGCVRAI